MEIIKYGLRDKITKQLITFSTQGQSEYDFCVSVEHILDFNETDPIWLVDRKEEAEKAKERTTEWYNAGYFTPELSYAIKKENLEVVKITLTIGD